jgi:hypothetical protein
MHREPLKPRTPKRRSSDAGDSDAVDTASAGQGRSQIGTGLGSPLFEVGEEFA